MTIGDVRVSSCMSGKAMTMAPADILAPQVGAWSPVRGDLSPGRGDERPLCVKVRGGAISLAFSEVLATIGVAVLWIF